MFNRYRIKREIKKIIQQQLKEVNVSVSKKSLNGSVDLTYMFNELYFLINDNINKSDGIEKQYIIGFIDNAMAELHSKTIGKYKTSEVGYIG